MKTKITAMHELSHLRIAEFGYEDVGERAKWERGRRNLYIIHYVLAGEGYYNGKAVGADEGFLIRPMQEAKYFANPDNPWKYFWISFDGPSSDEICKKHITTDSSDIFKYDFRTYLCDFIGKLFSKKTSLGELKSLAYFYDIISRHKSEPQAKKNKYVEEAKSFINLNVHRQVSVCEIAKSLKISDRYLYNLFIKYEGISTKQYITNTRIQNAKLLLKNSNCSITEVSASVGFPDVLTFSRFFKKQTELSPKEYRSKQ
jgi:AraC-like DNA-binding protein